MCHIYSHTEADRNQDAQTTPPTTLSGKLSANPAEIEVNQTTRVRAYDVSPPGQQVYLTEGSGLRSGSSCDVTRSDERSAARAIAPFTQAFIGCELGVWSVKLRAHGTTTVLASVNITVGRSTSTLPTVDAPSLTGTVQPGSNRLSWAAVAGANKYQVRHRRSGRSWGTPTETTPTQHTVSLSRNRTYDFQVQAHGDGTERAAAWGERSNTLVATTGLPPKPRDLTVDRTSLNSVTLSWPNVDGVAKYQVQYRNTSSWLRDSQRWAWIGLSEENVPSGETIRHTVLALAPQTTYAFRVRFRGDGTRYVSEAGGRPTPGPWSQAVEATTLVSRGSGRVSLSDLSRQTPEVGQEVSFTVNASSLASWMRYKVTLTVKGGDFGFNDDCSDRDGEFLDLRPGRGTTVRREVRIRACSVSTSTVIARLFHDPLSGNETRLHSHEVTVASAAPAPPTLAAGSESAFVGETVTLTARAQSLGSVAHYRWQEWSGGSWSDLGATTTSAARDVTSNAAAVKFYRVVVVYDFGTTVESSPVAVEWKAVRVDVTSSPDFPRSGPAATSTVTLTAGGDVPSGVVYQWQERTSGAWTSLGATTNSATKQVTSATRGTRKFRVVASHAGVTTESAAVYVTWDEWDIVGAMIGELSAAVASSTAYLRDQDVLRDCMRATSTSPGSGGGRSVTGPFPVTLATFDDLLASYTGDVKAKMEDTGAGGCATQSNAMFSTNEGEARAKLARLKVGNAVYAAWLATPQGQLFESNLGDPDELKLVSYLGATTFEPGEFTRPLYKTSSNGGRTTRDGPDEEELPVVGTGLDCLPQSVSNGADLTLTNKLVVLNCLVFSTAHDYWVQGDDGSRDAERLRRAIDSPSARFAWLDRGDWECTLSPDGPVPSCLKHDVAYGGLQEFAGLDANASPTDPPDGDELDEAWNPRNKALADAKFKADIAKWGCQDPSNAAKFGICRLSTSGFMAEHVYFWGTARVNHKGWPVTTRDLRHIDGLPRFIVCSEPVVPTVSGLTASLSGNTITATWTLEQGCVGTTLADVSFDVTWFSGSHQLPTITSNVNTCAATGNEITCSYIFDLPPAEAVTKVSISVVPLNREYGGDNYGGEGKRGRRYTVDVGPLEF